jgi:hypothetical protein
MSNTIRIKRRATGGGGGAPASLENAELAFNEQTNVLYYGTGTGGAGGSATSIIAIAGSGAFAPLDSPVFTGIPEAPTAAAATDTTQIATTAFVQEAISGFGSVTDVTATAPLSSSGGDTPDISITQSDAMTDGYLSSTDWSTFNNKAPIDSPTFTGTPLAPTAVYTDNTTQIATTAFVYSVPINDLALATGSLDLDTNKIINLVDPTDPQDAATKVYVDSVAQGLVIKAACVAATIANITLSGTQTIDGISVTAGQRVLVKDQTLPQNNGIYAVSASAWTRTLDADTWDELVSAFTFISQGTTQADSGWVCTIDAGGTLGTTPIYWTQFSGAGTYTAGTGLTLTGNQFSITNTAVTASTYGDATGTYTVSFDVNAQGQLTAANEYEINVDGGTF